MVKLTYPFDKNVPQRGEWITVAPGVRWLRMPLPMALDHINVWGLEDEDGWAVVDTGMRTEDTAQHWRQIFANSKEQRPLTRVFVTHMHPDHVGLAGWLTRKMKCRLWMTRTEYTYCRMLVSDSGKEAPDDALAFYRKAGWDQDAIDNYRSRFGMFGDRIHPVPDSYRRMFDNEEINIGGRIWRVITTQGHSPEHASLYCPELKVLISGDQVLPKISSNVSVYPVEPDANPLDEWIASLQRIRRQVPDDVLVLPSHNTCFYGLHARIDYLLKGHYASLDTLRATLTKAHRVIDLFPALFMRKVEVNGSMHTTLATGETLANLNYLLAQNEIDCVLDDQGVAWYRNK